MKITLILLILLTIFSMNTFAQDFPNTIPGGGHKESINSVSFSPDGLTLASGSDDKTICLWDVATGQLKTILQGHTDRITSVVFSPNGLTLASGSWDGTIHLWDATMGEHQQTLTGHGRWVTSVVFSPDGLTLASSGGKPSLRHPNVVDGIVNLWDVATGEHQQTLIGHAGGVRSVTFNPDGTTLASGSGDATIRLWDVATGKHKTTLEGHMDDITSISFSPDGLTLASGSTYSSALHLWDVATGKHKATLKARSVTSVVFSSDGLTLANGGLRGALHLWDVATGKHKTTLEGHMDDITSISFSPDGRMLASGSDDKTIRLWDVATGQLKTILRGYMEGIFRVVFSPDGQVLASGSPHGTIRLWDVAIGEHKATLEGHMNTVRSVVFSPDGRILASGSDDKTIRLWDVATGEHKATLEGHWQPITSISFSPDGLTLASGSTYGTIHLWNADTGEHKDTFAGYREYVTSISFSPDGMTLVSGGPGSGGSNGTFYLWDVATGEHKSVELRESRYGYSRKAATSVVFSPDGQTLASGSWDGTIRLWDVATGEHKATLEGHWDAVSSMSFSRDDRVLVSASDDKIIRLWDVATGEHKATLEGHWDAVSSVSLSPDSLTLASVDSEGTIYLWALSTVSIVPYLVESPTIGKQFTIDISIVGGKNVGGYQFTVEFDETALRYVESTNGNYLSPGAFSVPPVIARNEVTLGATSLAGVSNGDGTLATLTFEVIDVKESTLTLSDVILTDSASEHLLNVALDGRIVEPAAVPSSAVVSVTPSPALSPAIGEKLVLDVDIAGGQNVAGYQLTLHFDSMALEPSWVGSGDYLFPDTQEYERPLDTLYFIENSVMLSASSLTGAANGDGTLATVTFGVLSTTASTVSVSGYLIAPNGLRSIPTFEAAEIQERKEEEVIAPLMEDVNGDGVVNILDLVMVASSFGQQVSEEGDPADVNEDGVVNIVDLVKVAGALGVGTAAPSAWHRDLEFAPTRAEVQQWISQAQHLDLTDATSQRGIIFLEQLLAALTPKETSLLPNYPNPFNPETWIPYQLAEPADVTLTIYGVNGKRMRTLVLGHQPIGIYQHRSHAAYWDGKNEVGEPVASGVYFYTLTAGEFAATRKMLIRK